ncbi:protein suppressor of sable-like isoform X2 [Bradysia coprophila]|uniref:protein suppressor of sable-like isoform X2 n=1 Tax=Bradysia coprophila TaxID=38358 RepID=UPI00187D7267|nr:protein suppressor of sable-like isoform X2 [Bradysia coprophila]
MQIYEEMTDSSKLNETAEDLDLEDGEIESDNDEADIIITEEKNLPPQNNAALTAKNPFAQNPKTDATSSPVHRARDGVKGDKAADDDWMGDVENAIAMALKKDGIEPPAPKLQIRSNDNGKKTVEPEHQSSKGKKRKRRRLEKDIAKKEELKKKLKMVEEQIDGKPDIDQSEEMDEYEMMCIRGASPPPASHPLMPSKNSGPRMDDEPFYSDESYSSYDSYEDRIQKRRVKDRRVNRNKRDIKRRRDDSEDDRHEKRGPRKLELCKFYLMECCAKRDKCLYLHGDFPCKFYYLGMKNHDQDNCKFSHGKPLTDQMRNILLKHLETAPKEILGDFPRLKTETAMNMLSVQHQKLLKEFGMEAPIINPNAQVTPRIPSLMEVATKQPKLNADSINQMQRHIEKNPQNPFSDQFNRKDINEANALSSNPAIKSKSGKARKTRWCDTGPVISPQHQPQVIQKKLLPLQPNNPIVPKTNSNATGAESYLSLKHLDGVITTEQIEKLTSIGIENIDQMNQLTVAQLNELGLSVAQISEIQLNALNMQKLGLTKKPSSTTTTFTPSSQASAIVAPNDESESAGGSGSGDLFYSDFGVGGKDLDMRIPQVASATVPTVTSSIPSNCSQDIDMRILSSPHSSTKLSTGVSVDEELRAKSPTLTISTIASPDHQPSQANVVTALLPPVPPLTSSPVMSMLSKAQNSKISSTQSMFSDLGSSDTSSRSGLFGDSKPPAVMDYHMLDYSQYLKDSNIDLEKTDLEDLNVDDEAADDETNNLVVEDEPALQIDESWCSEDDGDGEKNHEAPNVYDNPTNDACDDKTNVNSKSTVVKDIEDSRTDSDTVSSRNEPPFSINVDFSMMNDPARFENRPTTDILDTQSLLPAVFDKFTLPSSKIEKIDVAKYLSQREQDNQKTDDDDDDDDDYETMSSGIDDALTDYIVGKDRTRDPRSSLSSMVEKVTRELQNKQKPFEFFSRHIPETSHPTPESLDVKSESSSTSKQRSSIYESSRSPLHDDHTGMTTTKDKDMRLSSLFMDDTSNGDVDFRLPFKPANFLPATEIDASEASHAHIEYKVHEVDIPKPDFTEIRRSINQTFDDILDPRLRKIFSQRPAESTKFSSQESSPNANKAEPSPDSSSKQRVDPRRRNAPNDAAVETPDALATLPTNPASTNLDIQTILQTSEWYKNLSSKQKIMANQQLAHLSGVLKKFHVDWTPNKVFDLSIVMQNPLLGQVLTNLGIYVDENGQFVKFTQTNAQPPPLMQQSQLGNNMDFGMNPIGGANMGMGVDMMNLPVMGMVGGVQDFNQPQMSMLQQQPPPNTIARFMGPAGMSMPIRPPNFMGDVRPGLLGVAPGIPYNIFDGQRSGPNPMFDRGQGGGGNFDHNFPNFDGNDNNRFPGRFDPMQPDRRNRMDNERWQQRGGRNCGSNNRNNPNPIRRNMNYDRRPKKN